MKVKGFTLVELMVVMAIIAFLSVGAYAGITYALRQGRDTQRQSILRQIQTALTAYYSDFQSYPGCIYNNNGGFGNGSQVNTTNGNYVYCPGAFSNSPDSLVKMTGQGGLAEYFENEFAWGPYSKTSNDNELRYYYVQRQSDGAALRTTVCALLENPRGGNVKNNCYCLGSDQSEVACAGMEQKK